MLISFGQNIWRRIQSCGLAKQYGDDPEFALLEHQITSLAFLPASEVPDAFDLVKSQFDMAVPAVENFITFVEETYVKGRLRRNNRNGPVRSPPMFPPSLWTHDAHDNIPRTQNKVESWHHRWNAIVGSPHVGLFHIIKEMQKEQNSVSITCEGILRGNPRPNPKAKDALRERRIQNVIANRLHYDTVLDF